MIEHTQIMIEYIYQFMSEYDLATELWTLFWLWITIGVMAAICAIIYPEEW